MKAVIVNTADIAAEPGQPLDAAFWCNREGTETIEQYRHRIEVERRVRVARRRFARLAELDPAAAAALIEDLRNDRCADSVCGTDGCPEHPRHAGDHTYEMHHARNDHVGDSPCRCIAR